MPNPVQRGHWCSVDVDLLMHGGWRGGWVDGSMDGRYSETLAENFCSACAERKVGCPDIEEERETLILRERPQRVIRPSVFEID